MLISVRGKTGATPYTNTILCLKEKRATHPLSEKGFSAERAEFFSPSLIFHNLPLDVLRQPIATMVILKPSALNQHNQDTH